ncbi:MAG: gamma carbonic anhydrase family protein [Deltaproteobacteria bacterium]|nr:gamma carbonic anhydrase family protein [Deltaproteobacteria bacterium]
MIYEFRGIRPKIHPTVFLTPSADVIGDVEIGAEASLWFNVTVRGDVHWIRIGEGSNIQDGSVLHVTHNQSPLSIGCNVTVGHSVTLHGCTAGDFALIGMRAVVLDDAEIGAESIVGACALVTQGMKIPPRSLVLGAPAKVVRPLKDAEIAFLHQSPENYKQTVRWYREGGFPEPRRIG